MPSLRTIRTGLAVAAALLAGCGREAAVAVAPARLADTGLYADFATRTVRADVLPFEPQYPLWSDGATKARWIHLPPGTSIDACDADAWRFPVGTKLWKEFSFGGPTETRYLEHVAPGRWLFAAYVWNAEGTDAVLAPESGARRVREIAPGIGHDVPSLADCLACHDAARPVLGFGALQLSPDRDPLAPHAVAPPRGAVDLPELVARGLLRGLAPEHLERPPRIAARSPRERAALGYLAANCGSCHDPARKLPVDLTLVAPRAGDAAPALLTALGRPSRFRGPGCTTDPLRIAPGAPAESVLVQRIGSRDPLVQMPPLGSRLVDAEALDLVAAWIREDLAPARTEPRNTHLVGERP